MLKNLKAWLPVVVSVLLVSAVALSTGAYVKGQGIITDQASGSNGLAFTVNGARVDMGSGASDYFSSDGTTITFAGPISAPTGNFTTAVVSFIDAGCGIVGGVSMNGGNIEVSGNLRTIGSATVNTSLTTTTGDVISGGDLRAGPTASSGSDLLVGRSIYLSPAGVYTLADEDEAVTITAATGCTTPTVTWTNGSANFQVDVGGTCAGVSTIGITFGRAVANKWTCHCTNISATATRTIDQSDGTNTTVVLTNYSRTLGTAADFADGADIRCGCRGG